MPRSARRPTVWFPLATVLLSTICSLMPRSLAGDCGPGGPVFYGYEFLSAAIVGQQASLAPFFLKFGEVYDNFFRPAEAIQAENNLSEWNERFCEEATLPDLQYIIYQSSVGELEGLRTIIAYQKNPLQALRGTFLYDNSFARHLVRYGCTETIDYLIFAKRCEPYVLARNPWEGEFRDEGGMRNLIADGRRQFNQTESHYIRLRYAYQLIRLAHYLKDYALTLQLYEELMPKIDNEPSLIDWWIEGHRAGALLSLGDNVKASYLYSRIFAECPSKRESAFRSFTITSDEEWERCLLLCKTDREKATLYVLRAQSQDARLLDEMRNIYALDPTHPALELLLVREMQQLEKDLLGTSFNPRRADNRRDFGIPRPVAGQRVVALQRFVRQALEEEAIARPDLWMVALGYLETLAGDYYFARQTFDTAEDIVENDTLRNQLAAFRMVLDVLAIDSVNGQREQAFYRLRRDPLFQQYPDLDKLVRDKFQVVYNQTGEQGKAFLLRYGLDQLKPNPQIEIIDNLLQLARSEDKNRFEEQLISKRGGGTIENDLLDMKATYYLGMLQLEAAYEIFKEIPRTAWDNYGQYAPYIQRLNDCVHCRLPDSVQLFNKGEMLENIIDLEYQARSETNADRAAILFLRVGFAYYNLTYFSYNWRAADYFRSGSSIQRVLRNKGENVFDYPGFPYGNREVFDCSRARYYFDRARMLARDPEIQARAAFWAAKCERNDFYTQPTPAAGRTYENFRFLATNFADTDFYQTAIAECKYFAAFVRK